MNHSKTDACERCRRQAFTDWDIVCAERARIDELSVILRTIRDIVKRDGGASFKVTDIAFALRQFEGEP